MMFFRLSVPIKLKVQDANLHRYTALLNIQLQFLYFFLAEGGKMWLVCRNNNSPMTVIWHDSLLEKTSDIADP